MFFLIALLHVAHIFVVNRDLLTISHEVAFSLSLPLQRSARKGHSFQPHLTRQHRSPASNVK